MKNTLPKINKYENTHKKWCLTNMALPVEKKCPKVIFQGLSRVVLKREFLNLLYNSDPCSWDFKITFF